MQRWNTPRILVAVVSFLTVLTTAAPGGAADGPAPTGVSWQSAGDSYSSGEGVFGNEGACAQSDEAYGPRAVQELRDRHGWKIDNTTFTACTGHLVEDYFNARGDGGRKGSLWDWGREQGGPERVDVLTMSFGGNDIGFASVVSDCVVVPTSFTEVVRGGIEGAAIGGNVGALAGTALSGLSGCDTPRADLERRIDALVDPPKRSGCSTRRRLDADFDCVLALQGRSGSIIDFYYDLVTNQLTDRGRLYVVGYPRIFADTDQWPWWDRAACAGVKRVDTEQLGLLAERLNNKLQEAVGRANRALGSDRVVFVDRFAPFRDGQHELCGRGDDWINGLSVTRGKGLALRKDTSFHPNSAGHADTARQLVERVDASFPRSSPSTDSGFLAFRPIASDADRRTVERLVNDAGLAGDDLTGFDPPFCRSLKVIGWDPAVGIDVMVGWDAMPEGCGGDSTSTFYSIRNSKIVQEAFACGDCDPSQFDSTRFREIVDDLAGMPYELCQLQGAQRGWFIEFNERRTFR